MGAMIQERIMAEIMYYKLEGKLPVAITMEEYFKIELAKHGGPTTVKKTTFDGIGVEVSTIFMGYQPGSTVRFFESMVFGGPELSSSRHRCNDYDDAIKAHKELCHRIAKAIIAQPGPWKFQNNIARDTPEDDSPEP